MRTSDERVDETSLWRHSSFLKLWSAHAVSAFGTTLSTIALPLTALLALGSGPLEQGMLAAAATLPVLAIGLFAGVLVDRVRRRPLMIAADVARAGALATVPLAAAAGALTMTQLYAVAAFAALWSAIFDAAAPAYLPSLVGRARLVDANAKLAAASSTAEAGGFAAGGTLVQLAGGPIAVLVDAATFLFSAISLAGIRDVEAAESPEPRDSISFEPSGIAERSEPPISRNTAVGEASGDVGAYLEGTRTQSAPSRSHEDASPLEPQEPEPSEVDEGGHPGHASRPSKVREAPGSGASNELQSTRQVFAEALEGARYVWRDPALRALVGCGTTLRLAGGSFAALYMLFAVRDLGIAPAAAGLIAGCGGLGSLAGAAATGRAIERFGARRTLVVGVALGGAFQGLVPLAHGTPLMAGLMLVAAQVFGDALMTSAWITDVSLRQTIVPDRLLGRVSAAANMLATGAMPAGALVGGMVGQALGPRLVLGGAALGFVASALWIVGLRIEGMDVDGGPRSHA